MPLKGNPTNDPIDELKAHKLCISAAREGWIPLFCATHASTVTSAIATPALPAVKNSRANKMCRFLCNDKNSMEIIPIEPEKRKHKSLLSDNYLLKCRYRHKPFQFTQNKFSTN